MRYRLRTLLILLALLPPILAVIAPPLAQHMLVGPQLVRVVPGSQPNRVFKTYALQNIDPVSAQQLLSQLMPRQPIRLLPTRRALAVLASPQDHAEVQEVLDELERALQLRSTPEVLQVKAKPPPPDWQFLPLIRPENAEQLQ